MLRNGYMQLWGLVSPKPVGQASSWRPKKDRHMSPKAVCWQHFLLKGNVCLFYLLSHATDWMRPPRIEDPPIFPFKC